MNVLNILSFNIHQIKYFIHPVFLSCTLLSRQFRPSFLANLVVELYDKQFDLKVAFKTNNILEKYIKNNKETFYHNKNSGVCKLNYWSKNKITQRS